MRNAKADRNQPEIVATLREAGCTVQHLHAVGSGCPDILVGFRGQNILMEIKDPQKPPSARKLNDIQQGWHSLWRGQVTVVETAENALDAIGKKYGLKSYDSLSKEACVSCGFMTDAREDDKPMCVACQIL
jgi:hypothetical protein